MKFTNQVIESQDVLLDGNQFVDCTFQRCKLIFMGIALPSLKNSTMDECTWHFTGPAENALHFMASLYAQGGEAKVLIERTFENIRNGEKPAIVH